MTVRNSGAGGTSRNDGESQEHPHENETGESEQ